MAILAVCGVKGGCGATTVAAALALLWQRQQRPVLAMDLCRQNLLRLHFGMEWHEADGWRRRRDAGADWARAAWEVGDRHLTLVPHGRVEEDVDQEGPEPEEWLRDELAQLERQPGQRTVLDLPARGVAERQQGLKAASHALVMLSADPAACALLDAVEAELHAGGLPAERIFFVINHFNPLRKLDGDVELLLRKKLGPRLAPLPIHRDEAVREAFAKQQPLFDYAPASQAADDLRQLAVWLSVRLDAGRSGA
ncbi:cellulose synthase operon protein YhjQ [Chromobacterium subtsugae]|uniref:Cellulose synthase operon protein YhjQ n=1 Tax=Chromobacterium subtsugae TaxID=251747 RepID=A0ABS7FJ57_9NEIS|nr:MULTISPECIES: cellulose biosynthesis protein BcsQ [Chromobacterium]MBW7568488.1 cellulose synthase operon protein YhjQ [Chromobacterium subtsugae]MBW8290117.1 cellulose synthase operon protein YhjQ [Chromobacterium subtsugae]WSE89593.1 cellulose biosynthesis protein BcsQ [Chromobacterium subtsugae]WVH57964.1 cellulose biosynthesis protein BcsQ [Chromobacterium subtsugae]